MNFYSLPNACNQANVYHVSCTFQERGGSSLFPVLWKQCPVFTGFLCQQHHSWILQLPLYVFFITGFLCLLSEMRYIGYQNLLVFLMVPDSTLCVELTWTCGFWELTRVSLRSSEYILVIKNDFYHRQTTKQYLNPQESPHLVGSMENVSILSPFRPKEGRISL